MMSASTASVGVGGGRNKFPFTATQYQELEHQALIYKYMAAGIPIPSDLLFNIKRSLDSSLSSKLFPAFQSSPLGWNPYQMGYGKKIDPEPGRCRRTDGKKWRCAKEAYPDSKYCERHMHRGKNRSRKPVESPLTPTTNNNTTSSTTTTANNNNNININNNCNSPISATSSSSTNLTNQSLFTNKNTTASLYSSYPSSDSSYNSTNPHLLYPHSSSPSFPHKDFTRERYYQGLKEDQGSEHAFFTETTDSSIRGFSLDESSQLGEKQSVNFPNYLQPLQNTTNNHQQQEKQCYIWGRDFNCELSMKVEEERSNLNEKTTHHFFDDLPITSNNKTNGGRGGLRDDSSSTTQLSISIPSSTSNHYDFFRNL